MKTDYKFINQFPKEDVYRIYTYTSIGSKAYDKITRKQMIKAIYAWIAEDSEWLENYMDQTSLKMLIHISEKKFNMKKISLQDMDIINKLENAYLIYFDKTQKSYVVPQKLVQALAFYEPTGMHSTFDDFIDFAYGLLLSRGKISMRDAMDIYYKNRPSTMDLDFESTLYNMPRFLIHVDQEMLEVEDMLIFTDCFNPHDHSNYEPVYAYTWSMYQSISKYGVNIQIDTLKRFYDTLLIGHTPDFTKEIIIQFLVSLQVGYNYLQEFIIYELNKVFKNLKEAENLLREVLMLLPNWVFKGDPLIMVDPELLAKYKSIYHDEDHT